MTTVWVGFTLNWTLTLKFIHSRLTMNLILGYYVFYHTKFQIYRSTMLSTMLNKISANYFMQGKLLGRRHNLKIPSQEGSICVLLQYQLLIKFQIILTLLDRQDSISLRNANNAGPVLLLSLSITQDDHNTIANKEICQLCSGIHSTFLGCKKMLLDVTFRSGLIFFCRQTWKSGSSESEDDSAICKELVWILLRHIITSLWMSSCTYIGVVLLILVKRH